MAPAEPSVPALWEALGQPERAACIALALPSMRRAPLLLRLRWHARQADLRNREVTTRNGRRQQFVRRCVGQGRIGEG